MTLRDCVRLLVVGLCAGVLPACMYAPQPVVKNQQQLPPQSGAPTPAQDPMQRASLSPYGVIPDRTAEIPAVARKEPLVESSSLPERPLPPLVPPPSMPYDGDAASPVGTAAAEVDDEPRDPPAKLANPFQPYTLPVSLTADPPLIDALRSFMVEKRPDAALEHLKRYDLENQEILLHLLPLTVRMTEGSLSQADPQEVATILDQLQALMLTLRPRASLVMDKACFCRQVRKFGVYEALAERPAYRQGDLVEVYCELRNVSCERYASQQGEFRTHLQSALEVRDPVRGFKIQRKTERADVSHTPQHDYYLHYSFAIKSDMRPGPHVVTVEVVDVPTGRKVSRKLEFVVRAD